MDKTGIIILAAGNSSRLGRPKQLLVYRGKTLLAHIATEAIAASLHPVVVVTGAYAAEMREALPDEQVAFVYNPRWEEGMASGIVVGLTTIMDLQPDLRAVIVAVCDQPYVSAELFRVLVEKHVVGGKGLIACAYAGTVGTPVLFDRSYFDALSVLSGSEGAKKLLKRHPDDMMTIPFPGGEVDIDTEEDVQRLSGI